MDDNKILDLFFERQENALENVRLKYGQRLLCTAMNILNNIQDSEECVSDTLLKAWEVIPPSRPTMLGAFLAKISRNIALNKWKAKNTERRGGGEIILVLGELEDCVPSSSSDSPEAEYDTNLTTAAINECLNTMDKTMRVVFVLRYFYGESIANIHTRFEISESKVKSMLFRARKKLKTHLEKEGVFV